MNCLQSDKFSNMAGQEYINMLISGFFVLVSLVVCFGQDLEEKCASNLKGCYCTDIYIDCSGSEFTDISELYPYITNRTYRIHATRGRIRSIPNDVFTTSDVNGPLNNVVYLNLSGNDIRTIGQASFRKLPNLETLDLSYNDISVNLCDPQNEVSTSLAPLDKIEGLFLSHVFSKEVSGACDPGNIFPKTGMSTLKKLDLSSNNFDLVGTNMDRFLCDTYSITNLNLSRNYFSTFPVSMCMTNVEELDVSNNKMVALAADEMDIIQSLVNLKHIHLGGNPFRCDCYLDDTFHWLNATTVPLDFDKIVCAGDTNEMELVGKPIKGLDFTDICEEPRIIICYGPGGRKLYLSKTGFIAGLSAAAVLIISVITVVVIICRRRRRRLRQQHPSTNSQILPEVAKSTAYSRMV